VAIGMKKKSQLLAPTQPAKHRKADGKPVRAGAEPSHKTAKMLPKAEASATVPRDPQLRIRRLKAQLAVALAQIDELRASAETDFLLEILNRRGFERELSRSIAYITRYQASGALIVLDVDRLKPINDAFGHAAGDDVLKAVVTILLRHVRASDVVARLGGDEFALLLWNLSEGDALVKAAALEAAIDQLSFEFQGQAVSAGASAGVALLGPRAEAREALAQADRAMYARKAERKQQVGVSAVVRR
jgi:diguanylate cyclase (GGDEF)-like protein